MDKIILKNNGWPGVDRSIIDFDQVHTVKVTKTKIVLGMYKKGVIAYAGFLDGLLPGEIVQMGNLQIKYKVIGHAKRMLPYGGSLYRVKRVDGANITNLDIDAISIGDIVKIKNRRSFQQQFDQVVDLINS